MMQNKQTEQQTAASPKTAMLLAAGLGSRLRPLTEHIPKPLVRVAGETLLERSLAVLQLAGVERTVINGHYLAEKLRAALDELRKNYAMELIFSDESEKLLDSAGGIIKALPHLGQQPFFVLNADTFWQDKSRKQSSLRRLARRFNPKTQDMLLLTVPRGRALTPQKGDFLQDSEGRLSRAGKRSSDNKDAVIYAGAMLLDPKIFSGASLGQPQSLNLYFDRAIAQKRLYGQTLAAQWFSVGTQAELQAAQAALQMPEKG